MALVNQETGATEWGAGVFTGLATATPLVLYPPQAPGVDNRTPNNANFPVSAFGNNSDRASMSILVCCVATEAFNLDYQFTADGGATWEIGSQVASSTVTVDGGDAGYTQSARLDLIVGYQYRVQIYNNSGSTLNGKYEWRLHTDNG